MDRACQRSIRASVASTYRPPNVALSDPLRMIATPLPTLRRKRGKQPPVQAILDVVQANDVDALVVGLPLTLEGTDSDWTREVRAFGGEA